MAPGGNPIRRSSRSRTSRVATLLDPGQFTANGNVVRLASSGVAWCGLMGLTNPGPSWNISHNPRVALGLDVTDIGRDIIRIDGTAKHVPGFPAADQVQEYVEKYTERIAAMFGTASRFAALFPEALIIASHRLHA